MTIGLSLFSRLKDPGLLRKEAFIAGDWLEHIADGGTFSVCNPANGEVLAVLPDVGISEVRRAIEAAGFAQKQWSRKTGKERAAVLRSLHDLMISNADDLATILTAEMGKPLKEAKAEILYGASYIEWFAEEAKRIYGEVVPPHASDKRILVIKQPVGVVGAITPWNFPNAMLSRKIAPALAVGCAVVAKPSEQTPLSALAIAVLAERAGLPKGLLTVLTTTNSRMVGAELCSNPLVRKITFTGSTAVGRLLMKQGADQLKRFSLELGGNAPFIVFDDADLDAAVEGALIAKFRNAGQTCVCANRIYVQSGIYDRFAARFGERVSRLNVGDGFADDTQIGPLIDERAIIKVKEHIADALENGASLQTGGAPATQGGLYFEPTVLLNVDRRMRIAQEETFGPVAPLFKFETETEAIAMANDTEFGLASYFYSRDIAKIFRIAEELECGMIGVNTGAISTEVAPFGGIKQSGFGREGSRKGADDYLEIKYLCLDVNAPGD